MLQADKKTITGYTFFPGSEEWRCVENPMPKLMKTRRMFVCDNHFEPGDYRSVIVKPAKIKQRFQLYPDILPHKNLPVESCGVRYSYLDRENDPLAYDESAVSSLECTANNSKSLDRSTANIEPFDYSQPPKRSKLNEISSKENVEPHDQRICKQGLVDRSVATEALLQASVSVQCAILTETKATQTKFH
ncbi:uncharacterized protein LOC129727733 [Wyeomyia smithii]|uniref:uncharacterized protein LOC129727733 n=1 Tax=Wyeomyia smithii TaxID=174621 RepID=UPI002468094B|nr:uncharacterized protein LOC129727733 [Wyeomyia smithii]